MRMTPANSMMVGLPRDTLANLYHALAVRIACAMEIIPVIDLRGATVVHARLGQRDQYRPIRTRLSATSDPIDVARGLLSIHPFTTLYVADLDAIAGRGDNRAALAQLKDAFPQLTLWVDNGIARLGDAEQWLDTGLGHL